MALDSRSLSTWNSLSSGYRPSHLSLPSIELGDELNYPLLRTEGPDPEPKQDKMLRALRGRFGWLTALRWWLPELVASILSLASLATTVAVLRRFDGRSLNNLGLPKDLTLNGIIAAISTINRVCLMLPVSAAISQEVWLWFAEPSTTKRRPLEDLGKSDAASRGSWGSIVFLFSIRAPR